MRIIKRIAVVVTFTALIVTNLLTLTSAAFNAALSGLIGGVTGLTMVTTALKNAVAHREAQLVRQQARLLKTRASAKTIGKRISARSLRMVSASVASIPAEAVPVIGIAAIIASTAYDLKVTCDNLADFNTLYRDLGIADESEPGTLDRVCNPRLPTVDEIRSQIAGSPAQH